MPTDAVVVGLDIGGANLKAADSNGRCRSRPFAIWQAPERLTTELKELLSAWPQHREIAVTMTAELADCYETKAEGVRHILEAVERAVPGANLNVWQTNGRFVSVGEARENAMATAASNWHALASFAGQYAPTGGALLIDIGTTTTDIIPLCDGRPASKGMTDPERLLSGELVYTGVRRTPLCALAPSVPVRGTAQRIAAELFATTLDVYLLLEQIPESLSDCETANGRPATRSAAHDRLARLLCRDRTELNHAEAVEIARWLSSIQRRQISMAIDQVLRSNPVTCETLILTGSGTFLSRQIAEGHPALRGLSRVILSDLLSPEASEAACAWAVACLRSAQLSL